VRALLETKRSSLRGVSSQFSLVGAVLAVSVEGALEHAAIGDVDAVCGGPVLH